MVNPTWARTSDNATSGPRSTPGAEVDGVVAIEVDVFAGVTVMRSPFTPSQSPIAARLDGTASARAATAATAAAAARQVGQRRGFVAAPRSAWRRWAT